MAPVPTFTLNNGTKVPAFGLGSWMGQPGRNEDAEAMVLTALKHGYRHFDTAMVYGNEEAVGKGIRASGIPREEIFVTAKFVRNANVSAKTAFESSLKSLGLDYIDSWLLHSPNVQKDDRFLSPEESPTYIDTWKEMEKVYEEGKVKSIGVSNLSIKTLEALLKEAKIVPATNQVELHPAYPQTDLLEYCKKKNILLTAYSPLGHANSPFFSDPDLQAVATKEGGTVSQVILNWGVQRGTAVVPKSEKEERIRENIQILSLSDASMSIIDNWHRKPGMHKPMNGILAQQPGKMLGWTYEELGWNLKWDEEKKWPFVV